MAARKSLSMLLLAGTAAALAAAALAQGVQPVAVMPGQPVEGALTPDATRLPDGTAYACYSVETSPGDILAVTLESESFTPFVQILRGALCSAASLQAEGQTADGAAQASIAAAGGRYLILARGADAASAGSFTLTVGGAAPVQFAMAEPPADGATTPEEQSAAPAVIADPEAQRRMTMERETAQHQARLAAEEAERLRQQAEAARRQAEFEAEMAAMEAQRAAEASYYSYDDYEEPDIAGGIMTGLMRGFGQAMESQARMESQFAETNAMIARMQAEEAARQRAEQAQQQQQAAAQAQERAAAAARAAQQRADEAAARAEAAMRTANDRLTAQPYRDDPYAAVVSGGGNTAFAGLDPGAGSGAPREIRSNPSYRSPPPVGSLTQDWSGWFSHAEDNGMEVSWRARLYDDGIRVQWRCVNRGGASMRCSVGAGQDKDYQCYAGNARSGQGGALGESAVVAPGGERVFPGDPVVCQGATFLIPDVAISATPS